MKTKIELDLKSLVLGAAAAAVVFFATGAGTAPGGSDHGLYQLHIGPNGVTALVNSQTGQVWTAVIRESEGQAIRVSGFLPAKEH